ncbi:hypothetical protein GF380_03660, partial [Candidatus Uhrbacteria bacterium]|nr:hypothetical protein [Candidatus Uhrbacteria bacterium]MBD3284210.1 hypothetical protein [Candidatus Uhrbacteria bacterium]
GHSVGNILIATIERVAKRDKLSHTEYIDALHRFFGVHDHRVIPVSEQATVLHAKYADGKTRSSEKIIDIRDSTRPAITDCWLDPGACASREALDAIQEANAIVLAPGDLYTSIVPVLLVDGIASAITASNAPLIQVINLATKPGQTDQFTAQQHVDVVSQYLATRRPDCMIVNQAIPPSAVVAHYESEGEYLVTDDFGSHQPGVHRARLIADQIAKPVVGDRIPRSLLRHDPDKLARAILHCMCI